MLHRIKVVMPESDAAGEVPIDADPGHRIVVGVDGSPSSIAALRYAERLAEALNVTAEAITTWEVMARPDYAAPDVPSRLARARSILDDAVGEAFPAGVPEGLSMSTSTGPPAERLIEQSEHAGMLVLGTRGHGGFAGLLLGSVSMECVAHARCPVLIVR